MRGLREAWWLRHGRVLNRPAWAAQINSSPTMEYASSREGLHHKLLESESKPSLPSLVRPRAECYGGKVRGSKGPGSTEICLGGNSRGVFGSHWTAPLQCLALTTRRSEDPWSKGPRVNQFARACVSGTANQAHRLTDTEGDFFSARTVRRSDRSPSHVLTGFGEFCSLPFCFC